MKVRVVHIAIAAAAASLATGAAAGQGMRAVSLAEAQSQALDNNPSLSAAAAQVEEARSALLQTWAARLPSVRLTEQVVRSNDPVAAFGSRLRQEAFRPEHFGLDDPNLGPLNRPEAIADYRTSLEISQPILSLADQVYGRRQAEAGELAAAAGLVRARSQVRLMTAQAYWGLALAIRALDVVERSLETAGAHVAVAQAHFRQGTAPRTEVLAAEVRVAELRAAKITAANRVREAADRLSMAMGWEPIDELVLTDTLALRRVDASLADLVAAARAQRSDLAAAGHQTDMARHALGGARSGHLPQVQAFAEVALDADSPLARQGESWTVGAMATWNIFTGLHRRGEIGRARARLAQAEERLRVSELKYGEGLMSTTDLLDAETAWRHARMLRLQALHDVSLGVAQLEFAAGHPAD